MSDKNNNTEKEESIEDPDSMSSTPPHFIEIDDLSRSELMSVLDQAEALKDGRSNDQLTHQTLGMIFQKPSARTRVSFEVGMTQLGGHAIFLGPDDLQIGRGEPLKDTSRTFSRYLDGMMVRVFKHENLKVLAEYANVPVINGLTDKRHPCQILADLLTIREQFGGFDGVQAAWVGDSNNVCMSFILGCSLANIDLTIATPDGYEIPDRVLDRAAELGSSPTVVDNPTEAVADADVVYTDVWISMGQEHIRMEKMEDFEGYQINEDLLAGTDAKVMHCLPAHRGEEITNDIIEGDRSIIWEQSGNRLHAQKALLVELLNQNQY